MKRFTKLMTDAVRHSLSSSVTPKLPAGGELLWRIFIDLCRTRTGNGNGPNPISHAEIEAYARLHRWPLAARHIDALLAMDRAFLDYAYAEIRKSIGKPCTQPEGKNMTLDAAAFDAVFG